MGDFAALDATEIASRLCGLHPGLVNVGADGLPVQKYQIRKALISRMLCDDLVSRGFTPPDADPVGTLPVRLASWMAAQPIKALKHAGYDPTLPPSDVHFIRRGHGLSFDFRSTDVLAESLEDVGLAFEPGKRYLDFGASSGHTVRTLALALPKSEFHGCDPVPASIEHAKRAFPYVHFTVTQQDPPTEYSPSFFDGIYAKSIWTHFSASAGKTWMNELARITKPGGFIAVTVHGVQDLARRLAYNMPKPQYSKLRTFQNLTSLDALRVFATELDANGFTFRAYTSPSFQQDLGGLEGASTDHWGLTFMRADWARDNLTVDGLSFHAHLIGRTGDRHDLLVFKRL